MFFQFLNYLLCCVLRTIINMMMMISDYPPAGDLAERWTDSAASIATKIQIP